MPPSVCALAHPGEAGITAFRAWPPVVLALPRPSPFAYLPGVASVSPDETAPCVH